MVLTQSGSIPISGFIAPDFTLPGTDGKIYTLSDFYDKRALVVSFLCNHCPYAKVAWPILIALSNEYARKGIQFVAINSNDEKEYPEDSFEGMKEKIKEWEIPFPYLRDGYQDVARAYGALCTPDTYLFNKDKILYYHGRINDRWEEQSKVTRHDLKLAIDHLLAGDPPPSEQIPSMGCSIKWVTKI